MSLRPMPPRDTEHFLTWCSIFHRLTPFPLSAQRRFQIGVYQLGQGIEWERQKLATPHNAWQSYAAAAIHVAASAYPWSLEKYLPERLEDIPERTDWPTLVVHLSTAQRMFIYRDEPFPRWNKRYNAGTLHQALGDLVVACFGMIPPDEREEAVVAEMNLICGVLR